MPVEHSPAPSTAESDAPQDMDEVKSGEVPSQASPVASSKKITKPGLRYGLITRKRHQLERLMEAPDNFDIVVRVRNEFDDRLREFTDLCERIRNESVSNPDELEDFDRWALDKIIISGEFMDVVNDWIKTQRVDSNKEDRVETPTGTLAADSVPPAPRNDIDNNNAIVELVKQQIDTNRLLLEQHNRSNLPRMEMFCFDGNPLEYSTFTKAITFNVENKTGDYHDRLYYLKSYTRGKPQTQVEQITKCLDHLFMNQRMSPLLLSSTLLGHKLIHLSSQAATKNYSLAAKSVFDAFRCPLSFIVFHNGTVRTIIHIPVFISSPFVLLQHNHAPILLQPPSKTKLTTSYLPHNVIAISGKQYVILSQTEVNKCLVISSTYYCHV
ncbi:uncharacterized protein LOC131888725 [Tigriopus californicus]|uniref:uncharacterized protein LOC131888725 n=1 Tax=Tigriopus californicus TaxID=6832 RepID=UPI0027DA37F6|nr:uncharacterized protein LOC131888725 [Tigriopus californicus]